MAAYLERVFEFTLKIKSVKGDDPGFRVGAKPMTNVLVRKRQSVRRLKAEWGLGTSRATSGMADSHQERGLEHILPQGL